MSWKNWIPFHGDRTVRSKLKELDEAGIGIPMLIILMYNKSFEIALKNIGQSLPIPEWLTFFAAGTAISAGYIYNKQLKNAAGEAKDKAKDKVEKE